VHGAVSVSATGVIAYRTGATNPRQLTWFDRSGRMLGTLGEPDRAGQINVELSHDGLRAAVQRPVKKDILIIDSARTSPFTFDPGGDGWPLWSPNSTRIVYVSNKTGKSAFYQRASGSNDAETDKLLGVGILRLVARRPLPSPAVSEQGWISGRSRWMECKASPVVRTSSNDLWGQFFSTDDGWACRQRVRTLRDLRARSQDHPCRSDRAAFMRDGVRRQGAAYVAPDGKLMTASMP
jgi:hypothetical protein